MKIGLYILRKQTLYKIWRNTCNDNDSFQCGNSEQNLGSLGPIAVLEKFVRTPHPRDWSGRSKIHAGHFISYYLIAFVLLALC